MRARKTMISAGISALLFVVVGLMGFQQSRPKPSQIPEAVRGSQGEILGVATDSHVRLKLNEIGLPN